MDKLKLQIATNRLIQDCCILLITETWLNSSIPDIEIKLASRTAHRQDRNSNSGKTKGGGVCLYVGNNWCTNNATINSHCSPDLEYITIKCRPAYLPWEFTVVIVTAVYTPPDANASSALSHLYNAISLQQNTFPDAVHVIAGDFNHVDLKVVLPKLYQHKKTPPIKKTVTTWSDGASQQLQDCFLKTPTGIYLDTKTWKSTPQSYSATSNTVSRLSQ